MSDRYKNAKQALENILNREWELRGSAPQEFYEKLMQEQAPNTALVKCVYFLRRDAPEIVTRGDKQIVISLNKRYVGKTRIEDETSTHYVLRGELPGFPVYESALQETEKILRELEFEVPEHNYLGIYRDGEVEVLDEGRGFVITPDLREGGRYRVEDVKDDHFRNLPNGEELKEWSGQALGTLQNIYSGNHSQYQMQVNGHVTSHGPQEASSHLFFVQIPNHPKKEGKIFAADLDHLFLRRR